MGFRSSAGAVYERARSNFGSAGQELYHKADGAVVQFAEVEFALAEARESEDRLGTDDQALNGWLLLRREQGDIPRSHTVYDDTTRTDRAQGGDLLDGEDSQQLRDVVAVGHIGLSFVVKSHEKLAGRRFSFLELGVLVKLGAGHGEVGLRVVFVRRFAELRVKEEGEQGHGDNVGGDALLIIFCHSEFPRQYAGVGEERVDAWQLSLDSVGKCFDRSVRAQVEVPHLKAV